MRIRDIGGQFVIPPQTKTCLYPFACIFSSADGDLLPPRQQRIKYLSFEGGAFMSAVKPPGMLIAVGI